MSKKRVAIICGGRSSEHPISCISARGVLGAIDQSHYIPILIGITESGAWIRHESSEDFVIREDGLPYVPESGSKLNVDIHGFCDSQGNSLDIDLAFHCSTAHTEKMERSKAFSRWPKFLMLVRAFLHLR